MYQAGGYRGREVAFVSCPVGGLLVSDAICGEQEAPFPGVRVMFPLVAEFMHFLGPLGVGRSFTSHKNPVFP